MREIIIVLASLNKGGAERVASVLSDAFVRAGKRVTIALYRDEIEYSINPMVEVVILPQRPGKTHRVWNNIRQIRALCGRKNKNVVLIPLLGNVLLHTLAATWMTRIPVIACERSAPMSLHSNFLSKLRHYLLFQMATFSVFQTEDVSAFFPFSVREKSAIILNPLSLPQQSWSSDDKQYRVVSLGRLHPSKNYPLLLHAFVEVHRLVPQATLVIYGEGELLAKLIALRDSLGLNQIVSFRGITNDVESVYLNAALYVSSSDYEGLSNSMLEAMAIGMPVVCTDCDGGGARKMILSKGNGYLVPKGDINALAEAIVSLLVDKVSATRMGQAARIRCLALNSDVIASEWIKIIDKME